MRAGLTIHRPVEATTGVVLFCIVDVLYSVINWPYNSNIVLYDSYIESGHIKAEMRRRFRRMDPTTFSLPMIYCWEERKEIRRQMTETWTIVPNHSELH